MGRERYADFSITKEMEPRIKGNWNPEIQDFTKAYKAVLKSKMSRDELEELRKTHEWTDPHRVDEDEPLYVNLEKEAELLRSELVGEGLIQRTDDDTELEWQ